MTNPEVTTMTAIGRAEEHLKAAVAAGDEAAIGKAQGRLDRARAAAALEAQHRAEREKAQRQVDQERRDAEKAAKKQLADEVEAELRSAHEPFAEIHAGDKIITVRLGHEDAVARGFAVEAVRRVAYMAVHRFQDRVVGSRHAGVPVEEQDWLSPMMGASHGLLHAASKGLVSMKDES